MQYKVSETKLVLKEFGRNIQSMVEYAKTLEDRDKRTRLAHEIVQIMANLNPQFKEIPDYKQKLWDNLFIISNFELDVDSPYPIPSAAEHAEKPKRMEYNRGNSRYKQYGYNIQLMVKKALDIPEGPDRMTYVNLIANTMKLFLRPNDRESMAEKVIASHLAEMSDGAIQVKPEDLALTKYIPPKNPRSNSISTSNKRSKNKNKNKNNKRRKKNHY